MINYLKIAWRNTRKHTSLSFINIVGLAIGIASCIIIFLYVQSELTFDAYNTKADRIARVTMTLHAPESDIVLSVSPPPLADVLQRNYPEVEATVRLENAPQIMKLNNEPFREENFYKADANIFSVFSFSFMEGSPATALHNPDCVVLTEAVAKKYFPQYPASGTITGKTITCNNKPLLITAVVKDRPANSDIKIDALLSADLSKTTLWMSDFSTYTFVLFKAVPNLAEFAKKLQAVAAKYVQPELTGRGDKNYSVGFAVEPLAEVHFSQGKLLDTPKGNKQFNYIFSLLAVFILVIALLNYINLSTAKATERAKEVGIRKVSGAGQFQLVRQFLTESFFTVTIAWLLAIALVQLALPFFNKLLTTALTINLVHNIGFIAAIFLATVLLSGLYPALVLSSFKPVTVLKGSFRHKPKGVFLRKMVTVIQFAIAAALIMGTTVIHQQMKFIQQKDLGFNKDQLLNVFLPQDSSNASAVTAFQAELRNLPEIKDMTVGSGMAQATMAGTIVQVDGKKREVISTFYSVDQYFLPVFQIQLLEGRNLSQNFNTDKEEGFLVNEAFLKNLGWKSGIGKPIEGLGRKGKIVGVVKNFYYQSLHNMVEPIVMVWNNSHIDNNITTIKIVPANIGVVKALYKKHFPAMPMDYAFFDEIVDKQYNQDNITMALFNDFTLLAVLVCCMGLYGLVALMAVQRTKEIGVRKILGASLRQLLGLMTGSFIKLVFWALLIALPVAGFVMYKWLASYAYHISLAWWMFLIPAILSIGIMLAVISREIIRAALANPVKSLRME